MAYAQCLLTTAYPRRAIVERRYQFIDRCLVRTPTLHGSLAVLCLLTPGNLITILCRPKLFLSRGPISKICGESIQESRAIVAETARC